jgi:hypothetical protein
MNNNTHGPVSWDEETSFGDKEKRTSNKDLFLHLNEGSNTVRIVTQAYQYPVHRNIKKEGEPGFGRKVPCSKENGSCPLCDLGHPISPRYYIGVIDRATNAYKVLDISWSTHQDIKGYAQDKIWGPPVKYDLNIIKDSKSKTKYYTVRPNPHSPLSPADQKIRDEADLQELEFKSSPLAPEVVQKIINNIAQGGSLAAAPPKKESKFGKNGTVKTAAATEAQATPTVDFSAGEGEDDVSDIFPDFKSASV